MPSVEKSHPATSRYSSLAKALLLSTALASTVLAAHPALAADAADTSSLEEVVVTARKRAENLQETPVSVSVISGDAVRDLNLRNFQDLRGLVPNLEILPLATGGASMTIRGIGQTSSQVNVDAKAGFYVDDMYVARQEGNQLYFYDVSSVQVLKGPQGTLFGKNTTAGAFLLTTARPSAEAGGYLQLRGGSFRRLDTEGAINIPLSDTVLTRFSFRTQKVDGYIKHVLDDETSNNINDQSARLQVRFTPTSKLTIDTLGEYNQSNTRGSTSIMIGCRPTAAYMRNYNALHAVQMCTAYPVLGKEYTVYGGATLSIPTSSAITDVAVGGDAVAGGLTRRGHRNPFNDTEVGTLNTRVSYDLTEDVTVKSITGYRRSKASWYNPTINAPNDIYAEFDVTETKQFTQEFNLNGRAFDGRLDYVAGFYFFDQRTSFVQDTGPDWIDPVGYTYSATNRFKSYAAYIQASLRITDPLELTVGGRYSYDKKEGDSDVFLQTLFTGACSTFSNAFRAGAAACGGHLLGTDTDSWESFDPRAQLSYKWTEDIFTYASLTRGYNAGGFNQQLGSNVAQGALVPYEPERVWSYEVGVKSEWFDGRLRFNLSGFYQKYTDIQTTVLVNINGVDTRQVQTGATAHEQGYEVELELAPIDDFVIRANYAFLDQEYDSIRPGVSFTLATPVNTAAKWTYSVSANYTFHLPSDAELVASLNWREVGKKPTCNPIGSCFTPSYGLLGGRLDYQPSDDSPWTAALWATNLLDEYVQLGKNVGGSMGIDSITPGRPREIGFEIRRTF
jgi:iron complex outermembrane receptor protein